jgi:hypothetical protein
MKREWNEETGWGGGGKEEKQKNNNMLRYVCKRHAELVRTRPHDVA